MAQPEFKNTRFLMIFGFLCLSSFFIFGVSLYGSNLYNKSFGEEIKNKGVQVGPVSLENKTNADAVGLLDKKVADWKKSSSILLAYNEKQVILPAGAVAFRISESLNQAKEGDNPLLVDVKQEKVTASLKKFKDKGLEKSLNMDLLLHQIRETASILASGQTVLKLGDFYAEQNFEPVKVSTAKVPLEYEYFLLEDWVKALNGYQIEPGAIFSLREVMEKKGLQPKDSDDLALLASSIYSVVAKSNFGMIERNTSRELPGFIKLGFEAAVDPDEQDLVFQNPNPGSYTLDMSYKKKTVKVSLVGAPFPFKYKTAVKKTVYGPRTIVQYNKDMDPGAIELLQAGEKGILAAVFRVSYDGAGKVVEKTKLSEDFYPPVPRMEKRGFPIETPTDGTSPADPGTTDPGSSTDPGTSTDPGASTDPGPSTPAVPGTPGTLTYPPIPETPSGDIARKRLNDSNTQSAAGQNNVQSDKGDKQE
ncbi:G5 domain-containing protein [Fictibacillus sp. KU28468]|uniref:G5 domain-containing protein n=1 Tax=Fictibacillus sp. KU28468 TaxID=2991053 RepID=UPI00223E0894|nr:G5 domain-containing protein [Fictibacillus sp. KU28468]UZJ80416.1 VanW family protein [Fictibacillus sp. KU28468]